MPTQVPGASMRSDLLKQAKAAFFAYRTTNPKSAEDPLTVGLAMFQRGYRVAFFQGAELAGLRPVLERWITLLEEAAIEREFAALRAPDEGE